MKKPNIVLISIDTLRADHMSCYGYQKKTTPNIDQIAGDGTVFSMNYSTGVWTPPGHASMLTGLYVSEHGVYGENRLHESIPTVAQKLKENGYQTAGFINNSQVGELVGFDRGHDTFVEVWKGIKPRSNIERIWRGIMRRISERTGYQDKGAERTNRLLKRWITNDIDREKEFYTFLHYVEPHNPLNLKHPFNEEYLDKPFRNINMEKINKIAHNPLICEVEQLNVNEEEKEFLKALYDSEIEYIDSKIGEVIQILKENNSYDNTMIIITADHGEHFGEHDLWSHVASLYNEVLRIPLIIKFPKRSKYIREVNQCTQLVDIFPTVMEITGISEGGPGGTSGVSLVHDGKSDAGFHDYVFAEWEGRVPYFIRERLNETESSRNIDRITEKMWMISDGEYKYISKAGGNDELYHMDSDEYEQNNLIDKDQEVAAVMKLKLSEFRSKAKNDTGENQYKIDEETKKNLEALGYM